MDAPGGLSPAPAPGRVWSAIGRQLQCPAGWGGRLTGHAMALVNREPVRQTVRALATGPGEDVLEVGFGSGHGLAMLACRARAGRVCGVDHSPAMVAQARRLNRAAIAQGRMRVEQGRFDRLAWPDASFDALLMVNVAYFLDPNGHEIGEIYRVLRPGGRIAVYVTTRQSMDRWPFCKPDTHRTFEADDIVMLMQRGGFSAEDISLSPVRLPFGITGLIAVANKKDCDVSTHKTLAARK